MMMGPTIMCWTPTIIEYTSAISARVALQYDGVLVDGVKVSVKRPRGK